MLVASVALGVFAVILAWPAPISLSRASWQAAAPASALLLWQAIALAGGLSMIGSLLAFGLIPFGDTLPAASLRLLGSLSGSPWADIGAPHMIALLLAVALAAYLVGHLGWTVLVTERQRHRHRQLLRLLSSPLASRPNTRLVEHAAPLAYCLPGSPHSVTVLSDGLLRLLTPPELEAVIEHEKAHLFQRHYLVLTAFDAWRRSLPWFPTATRAHQQVGQLIEMLADDHARRSIDDNTVASAIARAAGTPSGLLTTRARRLLEQGEPVGLARQLAISGGALGLVVIPTALLFAPAMFGS